MINLLQNQYFILNDQQNQLITEQLINQYKRKYKIKQQKISPQFNENKNQDTIAMWISKNSLIPPTEWIHDNNLKNKDQKNVAMILADNKIIPPKEWYQIDEQSKEYVIDKLIEYKIIPQEYLVENPEKQYLKYNETVAMKLATFNLQIPEYCYHNSKIQNIFGCTVAILQSSFGIIPNKQWYHDPQLFNHNNQSVAMRLCKNGIIPPREWMHDINLKNKNNQSIQSLLQEQYLPVPHHWNDNNMNIFDQACFNIIPNTQKHKSDEQNEDGFTVAMILAANNIDIPQQWYHNSNIKNKYGYTVALIQAKNGIIPNNQWQHDKFYRVKPYYNSFLLYSVQTFLTVKHVEVPDNWKYEVCNRNENNQSQIDAINGIIPKQNNDKPEYQDKLGKTTAMLILEFNQIIPDYWQHDPSIQDGEGNTIAMLYAQKGLNPPQEWYHQQNLKNFDDKTVGIILTENGIICQKYWIQNYNINDDEIQQMMNELRRFKQIKYQNRNIDNFKTVVENKICQICFQEDKQDIIVSNCGHIICKQCFLQLDEDQIQYCPICRQEKWFQCQSDEIIQQMLTQ